MARPAGDPVDKALAAFKALTAEQKKTFLYVAKHVASEIFALAAPSPKPRERKPQPKKPADGAQA